MRLIYIFTATVFKTGVAQMKENYGADTVDERQSQFIVRFIDGALLSERVVRLPNGYPTTEREKKIYEENQQKKEDELRKLLHVSTILSQYYRRLY